MKQHYLVRWDEDERGHRKYVYSKDKRFKNLDKRYGWNVKCPKCKWHPHVGGLKGLEPSNNIFLAIEKNHSLVCDGQLIVNKSYHAAEIDHTFAVKTTNATHTGDLNWTDIDTTDLTAAIASSHFTTGRKYLIYATAQITVNNINGNAGIRILHGTTPFDGAEMVQEPRATDSRYSYGFVDVWTAISGEGIKLQHKTFQSGRTVSTDQVTILAIEISEDLTENTDWHYDEDATDTVLSSSWSTANNATITFTPTAGDDWLVIGFAQLNDTSNTNNLETRLNRDDTDLEPVISAEGEDDVNDIFNHSVMRVFNLDGTAHTFEMQSQRDAGGTNGDRLFNSIFAINLDKFDVHDNVFTSGTVSNTDTSCFLDITNAGSISITPSAAQDVWGISYLITDYGAGAIYGVVRQQLDNADQPATQTSDCYVQNRVADSSDQHDFAIQTVNSKSALTTLDLDVDKQGGTPVFRQRSLMLVTFELAGVGAIIKVEPEILDLAEGAIAVVGPVKVNPEILDLSEGSVVHIGRIQFGNEILDLSESPNFVRGRIKVNPEILDLVEGTIITRALIRLKAEILDLAEAANPLRAFSKVNDEILDLVEGAINVLGIVKVKVEILDLPEQVNGLLTKVREVLELVESAISKTVIVIIGNETLDIPEGTIITRALVRLKSEVLELVEGSVITRALVRLKAEILDLVEDSVAHRGRVFVADEILDLPEASLSILGIVKVDNETLDLVEDSLSVLGLAKVADEILDLPEARNFIRGRIKVNLEVLDIPEARNFTRALIRLDAEILDLPEASIRIIGFPKIVAETLDLVEGTVFTRALIRLKAEILDLVEGALRVLGIIKINAEVLDLSEQSNFVRARIRIKAEVLDLVESALSVITIPSAVIKIISNKFRTDKLSKKKSRTDQVSKKKTRSRTKTSKKSRI